MHRDSHSSIFSRQNASLLSNFVKRQLTESSKGTVLGLFWIIVGPLISLAIFTVVFGYIFDGQFDAVENETKLDYAFGIFIGLIIYQHFASVITGSLRIIKSNENLVKKVHFPLEILPLSVAVTALAKFMISFVVFTVASLSFSGRFHFSPLYFLACVIPLLLISCGSAFFLAAAGVFFRDLGQLCEYAMRVLLYGSAIFYSAKSIPPEIWRYLRFNPVLHLIDQFRSIFLWGQDPMLPPLLFCAAVGVVASVLGFAFFSRTKGLFTDVL